MCEVVWTLQYRRRFVNDFWETSKKMLSDMSFLESLKAYDKVCGWVDGCE